ncbi:MAG TPA: hypothetical protein VHS03_09335 [Gaiellaceae bacterium]|nr:hypothetical protein [Gaiellaceae bacterium]
MQHPRAGRLGRLLISAVFTALVVPGVAQAHHTAVPVVALDYGNRILTGAMPRGVHASLQDAGRKLELTVGPKRRVTVLGYEGEPFLRFDRSGVAVYIYSTTAVGLRLVKATPPGGLNDLMERWLHLSSGHSFTWADTRVWAPASALHGRARVTWTVPLVDDGQRVDVAGELTKAATPPLWPWLLLGALPLVAAVVAARRKRWFWAGACSLAAVAGFGTLANLGGFATGGLSVSADRWVLLAIEVTLIVVALAALLRPRARLIAIAALAAFAVLQSLSEVAVFRHGIVVSGLPASAVRAAGALALGAGLGAAALVFLAPAPAERKTRSGLTPVRTSRKEQA